MSFHLDSACTTLHEFGEWHVDKLLSSVNYSGHFDGDDQYITQMEDDIKTIQDLSRYNWIKTIHLIEYNGDMKKDTIEGLDELSDVISYCVLSSDSDLDAVGDKRLISKFIPSWSGGFAIIVGYDDDREFMTEIIEVATCVDYCLAGIYDLFEMGNN